jgi:hypothetical protein
LILVLSPGRSGTHFLFSLCSTLPGVSAYHEPQPTLSCYEFAQGELSMKESAEIINQKTKKILESIRNSRCSTYIETSHTLLHHTLAPSPLIEGLLRNIDNRLIGIILLKRNLAEVMFSRARLGHMTRYVNAGKYYYRGVGWIYTPNSKNASLCPIKPDKQLTQLELLAGYVLNVENISKEFLAHYKEHPNVRIFEIKLDDLANNLEKVLGMMDFFDLEYDTKKLERIQHHGRTNQRAENKRLAQARDGVEYTLEECREVLDFYRMNI